MAAIRLLGNGGELLAEHAGLNREEFAAYLTSQQPTIHDAAIDRVIRKDKGWSARYQERFGPAGSGSGAAGSATAGAADGTRALEDGEVAEFAENSSKKRRR